MKSQNFVVLGAVILACVIGVGIPYYMTAGVREGMQDPRLEIPNTGGGQPTATVSTEMALTRAEFARLVYSPTASPTAPTGTFTLSPLPSPLSAGLGTSSLLNSPTATLNVTLTRRPFFFTSTSTTRPNPFASPTFTRTPTRTRTPTLVPTRTPTATPSRTATGTPLPTATPTGTPSFTPVPTNTPVPTASFTATPVPPTATDPPTVTPEPTDTSPPPTSTPVPPTDPPTDTPVPPTDTLEPPP